MYCDLNNLYYLAMLEKLPINYFICVESISKITKGFI